MGARAPLVLRSPRSGRLEGRSRDLDRPSRRSACSAAPQDEEGGGRPRLRHRRTRPPRPRSPRSGRLEGRSRDLDRPSRRSACRAAPQDEEGGGRPRLRHGRGRGGLRAVAVVVAVARPVVVTVRVALDVDAARHDEEAVPHPHDLDFGVVEARQDGAGDDVLDRADDRLAGAEIEHPVDGVDERVEFVGAEQDRELEVVAEGAARSRPRRAGGRDRARSAARREGGAAVCRAAPG